MGRLKPAPQAEEVNHKGKKGQDDDNGKSGHDDDLRRAFQNLRTHIKANADKLDTKERRMNFFSWVKKGWNHITTHVKKAFKHVKSFVKKGLKHAKKFIKNGIK